MANKTRYWTISGTSGSIEAVHEYAKMETSSGDVVYAGHPNGVYIYTQGAGIGSLDELDRIYNELRDIMLELQGEG